MLGEGIILRLNESWKVRIMSIIALCNQHGGALLIVTIVMMGNKRVQYVNGRGGSREWVFSVRRKYYYYLLLAFWLLRICAHAFSKSFITFSLHLSSVSNLFVLPIAKISTAKRSIMTISLLKKGWHMHVSENVKQKPIALLHSIQCASYGFMPVVSCY